MDRDTIELAQLWVGLIIAVLASIGTLITVLANARKTNAETKAMKTTQTEIQDTQTELHSGQKEVLAQFKNNGGSTMKDATDELKGTLREVRSDIRGIRADLGRLARVDMEDRERAVEEYKRIYQTIETVQGDISAHIEAVPGILKENQEETVKLIEEKLNEAK